jgi:hypothetical protein
MFNSVVFARNSGGIGGAIFFVSVNGKLSLDRCDFEGNAAACGAHFIVKTSLLIVADSAFTRSIGDRSHIEIASGTNVSFSNCNFFQNGGYIVLLNVMCALFSSCCMMNYTNSDYFRFSDFPFAGDALLILEETYINQKLANDRFPIAAWPDILDEEPESGGDQCRLEPTPSATVDVRFSSPSGIVALLAVIFPLVASVLGIVLVVYRQRKSIPFDFAVPPEMELADLED